MAKTKYSDRIVFAWFAEFGIPKPEVEYEYAKPRKFRADYAWPDRFLLLEVEGGIFIHGAHGSISGILNDIERSQHAAMNGFRIFKCQPDELCMTETAEMILAALAWESPGFALEEDR